MRPPGRSVFALRFPQRRNNPTYESISGNYVPIHGLAPFPQRMAAFRHCLSDAGGVFRRLFTAYRGRYRRPGQAQHQVADFVAVDCADIWAHSSDASDKNPSTGCGALTVPIASRRRRRGRRRNAIPTTAGRTRSVAASCLLMLKLPLRSAATWWRVSIPSARKSPFRSARCISSGATARPVSCSWWKSVPVTRSFSSPAIAN